MFFFDAEEEQVHDNVTDELEKKDMESLDSPRSETTDISESVTKSEDGKSHYSTRVFSFKGIKKSVKMRIPVTNSLQNFSAINHLVKEDLTHRSSSSRKCTHQGYKLHINKTKLHRAEKMIRGAFVELYKGLSYLKTYRYNSFDITEISLPKSYSKHAAYNV